MTTSTATTIGYAPETEADPDTYDCDSTLRFEDDPEAKRFCADHPAGATLYEVAAALGVTPERVRQIEERAIENLRRRLQLNPAVATLMGVDGE